MDDSLNDHQMSIRKSYTCLSHGSLLKCRSSKLHSHIQLSTYYMGNFIIFNTVMSLAAKPTALAHGVTRNTRAEHTRVKPWEKNYQVVSPLYFCRNTAIHTQKLPTLDKTYHLFHICPRNRSFSKQGLYHSVERHLLSQLSSATQAQ